MMTLWENMPKRLEWSNEFISGENLLLLHNWEEKRRVRHLNSECSITSYFAYYIFFLVNVKKKMKNCHLPKRFMLCVVFAAGGWWSNESARNWTSEEHCFLLKIECLHTRLSRRCCDRRMRWFLRVFHFFTSPSTLIAFISRRHLSAARSDSHGVFACNLCVYISSWFTLHSGWPVRDTSNARPSAENRSDDHEKDTKIMSHRGAARRKRKRIYWSSAIKCSWEVASHCKRQTTLSTATFFSPHSFSHSSRDRLARLGHTQHNTIIRETRGKVREKSLIIISCWGGNWKKIARDSGTNKFTFFGLTHSDVMR